MTWHRLMSLLGASSSWTRATLWLCLAVEDRKLERPVGEHTPTRYTLLARVRKPFEPPKAVLQDRERWKFGAQGAAPPFRPRARLVRYASRTSTVRPRPVDPSTATTRSTPGS